MEKYPEILIHQPVDEDVVQSELKPQSPEPEVEECCEDNQMRGILESLGLQSETLANMKSIIHVPPASACLHCKLMDKVKSLQEGITKINSEIESTEMVLKTKRTQNNDIKTIINRIESTIGTTDCSKDAQPDGNGRNCSCSNSCRVI